MKKCTGIGIGLTIALAFCMAAHCRAESWEEALDVPPWRLSINAGGIFYEGDEAVKEAFVSSIRLGYDYSPRWTFEGVFSYIPYLKANRKVYDYYWEIDDWLPREGLDGDSAAAYGFAVDALYHLFFLDNRHWDPYLIGGIGLLHYTRARRSRDRTDITFRYGAGLAYHINPTWSVRADVVGILTMEHTEFNVMPSLGVGWRWGVKEPPPRFVVSGGPIDRYVLYIEFETDKAVIPPEFFAELDEIGETLRRDPTTLVHVEGHADRRRTSAAGYNWKLSERRARAVADYLHEYCGIARERMEPAGYGFTQPIAPNDPVNGNSKNRRVEINVYAP